MNPRQKVNAPREGALVAVLRIEMSIYGPTAKSKADHLWIL